MCDNREEAIAKVRATDEDCLVWFSGERDEEIKEVKLADLANG